MRAPFARWLATELLVAFTRIAGAQQAAVPAPEPPAVTEPPPAPAEEAPPTVAAPTAAPSPPPKPPEDLNAICEIDPKACPVLDIEKERSQAIDMGCEEVDLRSAVESPSSKVAPRILMPSHAVELGAEMVFLTRAGVGLEKSWEFTDVALFRLRARRSFADWLELNAGTSLLAKQPTTSSEPIWQGASGGVRVALGEKFAIGIGGGGGPLMNGGGRYWQIEPSLAAKPEISSELRFLLGLASSTTLLEPSEPHEDAHFLEELVASAEIQLGDRPGAFWVNLSYGVPLAWSPTSEHPDSISSRFLDPQVHLSLQVGGVLSLGHEGWDVFAAYTLVDRGELDRPETTLPILDGGFDQQQTTLGVQYRFGKPPRHSPCGE